MAKKLIPLLLSLVILGGISWFAYNPPEAVGETPEVISNSAHLEPIESIASLRSFLVGGQLCERASQAHDPIALEGGILLPVLDAQFNMCSIEWEASFDPEQLQEMADRPDEASRHYDELRGEASKALDAAILRLKAEVPSNDPVDRQVLAFAASWLAWSNDVLHEADDIFLDYQAGEKAAFVSAVSNAMAAGGKASAAERLMDAYPWQDSTCIPPPAWVVQTTDQVRDDLARLRDLAAEVDGKGQSLSSTYGRINKTMMPDLEFYAQHGFWPAVLRQRGLDDMLGRYLALDPDGPGVPDTPREAAAILARYHSSEERTLQRDEYYWSLLSNLQDMDIQKRNAYGRQALALSSTGYYFEDVPCE